MKLFLARLPKSLFLHSKGRVAILAVVVVALGVQWFTWFKRNPVIAVKQAEIQAILELEAEVRTMEADWSEEEAEKVASRLRDAQAQLFDGDPKSSTWSAQIQNPPQIPGMEVSVRPESTIEHPEYADKLEILPTVWMLKQVSEDADIFSAVLVIMNNLATRQQKWMDLSELIINGNEEAPSEAQFQMRLWFRKQEPAL
ncbi:MAG: hypothetical protein ACI8UO_002112 [Verrucomicrobiales bacterium]|jgi:hypothetical protein